MDSVFSEASRVEISKLLILAPQGAEYQAVVGAIKKIAHSPVILPIPVGKLAVTKHLHEWRQNNPDFSPTGVILMGLGGSLSAEFGLGQTVLLESCLNYQNNQADQEKQSDRALTDWVQQKLDTNIRRVQGLTSDRVITDATEKQELGKNFNRQVVEMEGWAVLNFFSELGIPATIIRVISDEVSQSLPDLSKIYDSQGQLNAIALVFALGKKPIAGLRLIVSSLRSLKILNQITDKLFSSTLKNENFGF
jgi:nucleoside phosphorylase